MCFTPYLTSEIARHICSMAGSLLLNFPLMKVKHIILKGNTIVNGLFFLVVDSVTG